MIKLKTIILLVALVSFINMNATKVEWICSTNDSQWQSCNNFTVTPFDKDRPADVNVTSFVEQEMLGFGGCFSELGWDALSVLDESSREQILAELFDPQKGLCFTANRTPIAANDFARDWYSYDEVDNDFQLKHFSIARDKTGLIPYIKAALRYNPQMMVWASPWSPPTWMKTNHHYATKADSKNGLKPENEMHNGDDQFIAKDEYYKTYAKYFSKYLTAYKKEGVKISMVIPQNEPYTINIWPNTAWTPGALAKFISKYLGPELEKTHKDVAIWHGTLNTNHYDDVLQVMNDNDATKYIKGVAFQWEGKDIIARFHKQFPQVPLMCSENECGGGSNDWGAAEHTCDLMKTYIGGGANYFVYFNMVLKDKGSSSWGWDQNSLIVVDSKTKNVKYSPEFYLMKHLSHFVHPGSHKVKTMGNDQNLLAFLNEKGETVLFIANKHHEATKLSVAVDGYVYHLNLKAKSFNTFVIKK